MDEKSTDRKEEPYRFFGRHLVSLAGIWGSVDSSGNQSGIDYFYNYSGFIYSYRNKWFWITAGHALEGLDISLNQNKIKLRSCYLVDTYGPNPKSIDPIPFCYEKSKRFYYFDENMGLDFGLIHLRPYYCGLLKTNSIVPLSEENRIYPPDIELDEFILLGLPISYNEIVAPITNHSSRMVVNVHPTIIRLEELIDYDQKTKFYRFVGKISNDLNIDITGMSGGPIIGFSRNHPDRYWIVAVQSSWLPESKVIFGCPVPTFSQIVENIIKEVEDNLID